MNSLKNNSVKLISLLASGLGVLSAVLRIVSLLFFYDAEIGYYTSGAVLPIISNITFALSAVAVAALSFLLADRTKTVEPVKGNLRYAALLPAAAILVETAFSTLSSENAFGIYELLMLLSGVASVAFFASLALSKQPSALTVGCGVGFILWLALNWLSSYTDFTVTMNSPDKVFFHFACVGAALFAVAELRAAYGMAKTRTYICYTSLSVLTLFTGALVPVIGSICGVYEHNPTVAESAVLCALLVYAVMRSLTVTAPPTETEGPIDQEKAQI